MTQPTTTFAGPRERPRLGLKDGGHVILRCSNCDRPLADVFVTQPGKLVPGTNTPFTWRLRARCCYGCTRPNGSPEHSFIETVEGLYHLGGYGEDNPDDPEDSRVVTVPVRTVDEYDSEGNAVMTIEVKHVGQGS